MTSELPHKVDPRQRTRTQILRAAKELITKNGHSHFTANEIAAQAGISRRSVFNHFISLDAIVMEVCAEALAEAITGFQDVVSEIPHESARNASELMSQSLQRLDLLPTTAYMWKILGADPSDSRTSYTLRSVFLRVNDLFAEEALARDPNADSLEISLRVNALVSGLGMIAGKWANETEAAITPETRALWDQYIRTLLNTFAGPSQHS